MKSSALRASCGDTAHGMPVIGNGHPTLIYDGELSIRPAWGALRT